MRKIGIVGQGYVGTAVKTVFEKYYDVETYDINKSLSSVKNINELARKVEVIFVCVPTPMNEDGSCNIIAVDKVVKEINFTSMKRCKYVVIKSTIPPGTTTKLNKECKNIQIIFNPEFLTEANFIEDFKNQNRIILGGPRPGTTIIKQFYSKVLPNTKVVKTGSKTAEMVKYMTNTFLATKVSFANEMKQICDKIDIDYDKVVEYSTYDERLGKSHWAVPGPDGKLGFGGSCFPKDLNAILDVCRKLGVPATTLFGAWQTNEKVRPERDWELLKGRAVVDDEKKDEVK